MVNIIDGKLGIYEQALEVHGKRAVLLANNLANANTPGYKATDINFKAVLQDYKSTTNTNSITTSQNKGITTGKGLSNYVQYRTVAQPSLDGNTVDGQVEQAEFAENNVRYLAALNFLNDRAKNLMLAIKGTS